jgi:hypothetical protein
MAEIPVERKSNKSWLWLLLLFLLVGLLIWWLVAEANEPEVAEADPITVGQTADATSVTEGADAGEMTLASILANPSEYYGREGFTGEVQVGGPLTDRGFWIENDGARMFAIVIDEPAERRIDINTGARLQLNGGTVREASTISATDIDGDTLDQDTVNAISDQEVVLVIDEDNIQIAEAA